MERYLICGTLGVKLRNMVEKVQRSFRRFISGMACLSCTERLTVLKLYSLQRRRERDILLFMCGRFWRVWSLIFSLIYVLKHRIVEGGPVSHHT